ncbi:MAG: hypothetical protein ABL903_20255 [Methylococcales bacterium]
MSGFPLFIILPFLHIPGFSFCVLDYGSINLNQTKLMDSGKNQVRLSDEELFSYINQYIKDYKGYMDELENAIGALIVGRHLGWKPLYILHSIATIKKYQVILHLDFKVQMPEVGAKAKSLVGWKIAQQVSNFWKLVSGQTPEIKKTKDWKMSD